MATVVTPHCFNQAARASRLVVKVPNSRTETVSRSSGTATRCRSDPISIPAAFRFMCCNCGGNFGTLKLLLFALLFRFVMVSSLAADLVQASDLAGAGKQEFAFFLTGY